MAPVPIAMLMIPTMRDFEELKIEICDASSTHLCLELSVTNGSELGLGGGISGYSCFLNSFQMASHDLAQYGRKEL